MFCEKCGNPVGESEKFCSQCGAPLPEMEAAAAETAPAETAAPAAETAPVETAEAAAAESAPVALSVPQVQEAPIAPAIPEDKPDVSGKKPKKKKAPLIIAACAAVAAAAAAICVAVVAGPGNFFRRSFSSPEEYYRYVEGNTVSAMAGMGMAYYDMLIMESLSVNGRSADIEFEVELGEGGQELLGLLELADVDLTWLTDFSVGVGYSLKDYLLGYDLSFGLNQSDILSIRTIMDLEGGAMYLQVPELTADYIGVDLDEITDGYGAESFEAYREMQETFAAVRKAMPDAKEVEKLLQKYLNLALSGVSNVDKSTKTVKAGGVQQKCTELEVTFDGKSLSKILRTVLKEIPKDNDLKKLFVSMVDSLQEIDGFGSGDGEDAWDAFAEQVKEALDSLDELEDMDEALVMKVYVDDKGKIVGRVLELVEDRETFATVSVLALEKGSKFGYEFSVQSDSGYGSEMALTGSGKKSGNILTGDFELKYGGMSVLDLKVSELDMGQIGQGHLNGSITMTLSKQIADLLSTSLSYYGLGYGTMLADMQLVLDFQIAENSDKITLGLNNGREKVVSISMSAETGDGSQVSVPDARDTVFIEDDEDLADWLEDIDWAGFIERLDKADLPDEVMDLLEEISGLLGELSNLPGGADVQGLFNHYDEYYYDDSYQPDEYYGDSYQPDEYYGEAPGSEGPDSDSNSNDIYGGSWWDDDSLEQLLQSDEWQREQESWNDSVAAMGITVDTVADGNMLVFEYHLPDDAAFNEFGAMEGSLMADAFLGALQDADFMEIFVESYGISLDAVQCVIIRADGTEIYRGEMY